MPGLVVTDPNEFLLAFHATYPGATSQALARGRGPDGRSSYELLAAPAEAERTILDLGCGDGFLLALIAGRALAGTRLLGVDMSREELNAAAARAELADASLLCARGDALPLADASVDWGISHLAFMLMTDIDAVAVELRRVLRVGGRFSAIVGGGPTEGQDAFALFLDLFQEVYAAATTRAPRLGDKRARHGQGFAELFADGFAAPTESVLEMRYDGDVDAVWDTLRATYELFVLSDDAIAGLEERFKARAAEIADDEGIVACTMRMRHIEVIRI